MGFAAFLRLFTALPLRITAVATAIQARRGLNGGSKLILASASPCGLGEGRSVGAAPRAAGRSGRSVGRAGF